MDELGVLEFREAVEARDYERLHALLDPDVVFHSPVVYSPAVGRDQVMRVAEVVLAVTEDRRYLWHVADDDRHVLGYSARVGDNELEGVEVIRFGDDGRISELAVMIRPLSGLRATSDAVGAELARMASL